MRRIPSKDRSTLRRVVIGGGLSLALLTAVVWTTIERRKPPAVRLDTPDGAIVVEVADAPAARSAGLSNRESLVGIDGLLLKWDTPGRHPIWMAEMRFPLDLAWIDANGRVIAVLANVQPCQRQPCPLYEPDGTHHSVAVLELRVGAAATHGIAAGNTFEHLRR
jgi:uncharacterized membrane protein (UPF0127 family)